MNTIQYLSNTGVIVGFVSGTTLPAEEGWDVVYTTKELPDVTDCVVLDNMLVPRLSEAYALSDKSSDIDKGLYWKQRRAELLSESDFMMLPDVGDAVFQERAKTYRQQLRDLPSHPNWPRLTVDDLPAKPNPKAVQLAAL